METLRGFVSDEIYEFLSSTTMDSDPLASNLDDPSNSHASIDVLDAHIDALLLASSQQFEEAIEPETKRQRLDFSLKIARKKNSFLLYLRQRKKLQKPSSELFQPSSELFQPRHLQTMVYGENGETTDLLCTAITYSYIIFYHIFISIEIMYKLVMHISMFSHYDNTISIENT